MDERPILFVISKYPVSNSFVGFLVKRFSIMLWNTANRRRSHRGFSAKGLCQIELQEHRVLLSGSNKLEAVLAGSGTSFGEAEYENKDGQRKFEVKAFNATPGLYDVVIDGVSVGTLVVQSNKLGALEIADDAKPGRSDEIPIPANWPDVKSGTGVKLMPKFAGATTVTGTLKLEGEDDRIASNLSVRVVSASGGVLESEYEVEKEGSQTKREFELKVYNLTPDTDYAISIGGAAAGTLRTNALGTAARRYSDRSKVGYVAFPASFPQIAEGTTIAVGQAVNGAYAAQQAVLSNISSNGDHTKIDLYGTTSIQGRVTYEVYTPAGASITKREFKAEVWNGAPGSKINVTVGGIVVGQISVNTKGYGKLAFEDGDSSKAFPGNWPGLNLNTIITIGNSLSGAVTGVNQTLAPTQQNARDAYELDQSLGLTGLSTMYENWGGKGEKWLKGRGENWYFVTPDGSLYRWDGKPGSNGERIAALDDSFYLKPELLHSAKAQSSAALSDDAAKATAAKLDRELNLVPAAASTTNWGGTGEKWFRGNGSNWYFITADGTLTRWDKSGKAKGTVVGTLDSRYHEDSTLLSDAEKYLSKDDTQIAAKSSLKLTESRGALKGWQVDGVEVKWLKSADNKWYFITKAEDLVKWDGSAKPKGTVVAKLKQSFDDPAAILTVNTNGKSSDALAILDDLYIDLPDLT